MALSIDDARAVVLGAVAPLEGEDVPLDRAAQRVLGEDVVAAGDVPPFANSAMDGFAVHAVPAGTVLRVTGESRAGAPCAVALGAGEAIAIATGAMVPEGATAVVPIERVEQGEGEIRLTGDIAQGANIRRPGEDMRAGETVLHRGMRLGAAEVGVAAGAGRATLRCTRTPVVAIVVTGDELRAPGSTLHHGEIHESNGLTLAALAVDTGAVVHRTDPVADRRDATREALGAALEHADVVVASGGVSVGPHDHVKGALSALGVRERFWGVALRPGKPTWFGTRQVEGGVRSVFGLPGNPVSAMVTFMLFTRPALLALQGADPTGRRVSATLTEPVGALPDRAQAVRVRLEETFAGRTATPTGPQGSHQLRSMVGAQGLAIVPAGDAEVPAGASVTVELV
ncbi:MAG TPA: gephyrin-like molybdotransferase Glp [Solirubrobacteraceae bacterium]|nr:gephyrin-like molybdotransferase Glp [Solirubrobacteraceae bacterium]